MQANSSLKPVQVDALGKRYGQRWALRSVTFSAGEGELVAIIGPNGAGKTTLLGILAGLIRADSGSIESLPERIGWVPQDCAVYRKLSVKENLQLFARLEGATQDAVTEMLAQTGLGERADEPVEHLSGGNVQRLNIAAALMSRPNLLLLDEPTGSLDPRQRQATWQFIQDLAGSGTTVVFSTHNVEEAEYYASSVVVVADGESLFTGTPKELKTTVEGEAGERTDLEHAFVTFLHSRGH